MKNIEPPYRWQQITDRNGGNGVPLAGIIHDLLPGRECPHLTSRTHHPRFIARLSENAFTDLGPICGGQVTTRYRNLL